MRNETLIDQNLQGSFENFLMSSNNISQQDAATQISQIQQNAMNLINSQDPEIQRRLDLIEEIDADELNEELQYLMNELSTNSYSAEDQMQISNALFNIFGFNIELDANNEVQINLIEPTIDDLEYQDDTQYLDTAVSEDYLDDDFAEIDSYDFSNPLYENTRESEGTYSQPAPSTNYEKSFSYDDFDNLTTNEDRFEARANKASNNNQNNLTQARNLEDLDYDFDY